MYVIIFILVVLIGAFVSTTRNREYQERETNYRINRRRAWREYHPYDREW